MKVTITTLKIPYIEAIKLLREKDTSKTITECQNFINKNTDKVKIIDRYTNEYDLLNEMFNMTSEPYSNDEKYELLRIQEQDEKAKKTLAAWEWIDDNVNDEGKAHINFLIDNGGPGPACG